MSPEQARGQSVDRRTDIWAFGCVLFEMLTGRAAFVGATMTDTLARVLEHEPEWAQMPASVAPGVRSVLRRCLAKDVKHRFRDIGDVRIALEEAVAIDPAVSAARRTSGWGRALLWVAAAIVLIATLGIAAALWPTGRVDSASKDASCGSRCRFHQARCSLPILPPHHR